MIRLVLLVLVLLLAAPMVARAQKDKMHLGEALGATVTRAGAAPTPPTAVTAPASRDHLTVTERLIPVQQKGAR